MKKLEVNFDPTINNSWESLGIDYKEDERTLDDKLREAMIGIYTDKMPKRVDVIQYIIGNLTQEELVVIADMFIFREYTDTIKSMRKEKRKNKKNKKSNPIQKMKTLAKMLKSLEGFANILGGGAVHAGSREELYRKLAEEGRRRGFDIDVSKFDNCKTGKEFMQELNNQLKDKGRAFFVGESGNIFERELKDEPQEVEFEETTENQNQQE